MNQFKRLRAGLWMKAMQKKTQQTDFQARNYFVSKMYSFVCIYLCELWRELRSRRAFDRWEVCVRLCNFHVKQYGTQRYHRVSSKSESVDY